MIDFKAVLQALHGADIPCRVANLDVIIQSKRATRRPKDLNVLPELNALKELKSAEKGQKNSEK